MQKYLIFAYKLKLNSNQQPILDWVSTCILNPKEPENRIIEEYSQLNEQNHFQSMIVNILNFVNSESLKFKNVFMVAKDKNFFQNILRQEFHRRNLIMPYVFKNNIDLLRVFFNTQNQRLHRLQEIQEYFQIEKNESDLEMIQSIILKMISAGTLFVREGASTTQQNIQQDQQIYFKTVGWPFQIRAEEIRNHLIQNKKYKDELEICFINQNNIFSGIVFVKSPSFLRKQILQKDRSRVGNRYVQVRQVQKQELQVCKLKYTISQQNIRKFGKSTFLNPRYEPTAYQRKYERIQRERSRSGSSYDSDSYSSRSRGYQKNRSSKRFEKIIHNHYERRRTYDIPDRKTTGVRIRGLPFHFNERDVLEILKRHYPLFQSVKMGHKDGRRSGQAVVLFDSYRQAYQALEVDGLVVGRRYLQAILISLQDYERFK